MIEVITKDRRTEKYVNALIDVFISWFNEYHPYDIMDNVLTNIVKEIKEAHTLIVESKDGKPLAYMGINDGKPRMMFIMIKYDYNEKEVKARLYNYAKENHLLDVV